MMKNRAWLKEQLSKQINILHTTISSGNYVSLVKRAEIMNLIDQLEEPEQEKVVIPQFVADWIDYHKADNMNLGDALNTHYEDDREIHHWLYMEGSGNNDEIFARAWLDGYSVEKEKLYKVELPIDRLHHILTIHADGSGHFFGKEHMNNYWYKTHLTEREIKAIDERFWAFAEEIME